METSLPHRKQEASGRFSNALNCLVMEVHHRLMLDKRKADLVEYQGQMSRTGRS